MKKRRTYPTISELREINEAFSLMDRPVEIRSTGDQDPEVAAMRRFFREQRVKKQKSA